MVIRVNALKAAVYFRNWWYIMDFINGVEAIIHILLKIIGFIFEYNGGSIRPFLLTIYPILQCVRVLKFFRLLNPYSLPAPVKSVLHTMDEIGKTFHKIILIIAMILIVMVTTALVSNIVFADSLQYRCVPSVNATLGEGVLNDTMYITYGLDYYNSSYNDRYCGTRSGAKTCEEGFECSNIGIGFAGGIADFNTPGKSHTIL